MNKSQVYLPRNTNTKIPSILGFILAITIFFPEVGIVSFSDVQPNFFVMAALVIVLLASNIKVSKTNLVFFSICIICLWLSFVLHNNNVTQTYILKYTISTVSIIFCYILCSNNIIKVSQEFILIVAGIYIAVAMIQFIVPDFMTFLVTRDIETSRLISTGRGMLSLTGEPSHFGKTITILNILYIFIFLTNYDKRRAYFSPLMVSSLLFISNLILSQSFYACFFHFICLLGISYIFKPKTTLAFITFLFFGLIAIISYFEAMFPEARIIQVAFAAFTDPELLLGQGAMARVLNIPLSFINLLHFGVWGAGNSSDIAFGQLDLGFGILEYKISNRMYGGFSEYILKLGILSIPLFIGYLFCITRIAFSKSIKGSFIIGAMLLMLSMQDGSPASPLMIFAIIYAFVQTSRMTRLNIRTINNHIDT